MSFQTQQYITLDSIINDYIDESEQSIHKYAKLFNIAFRGMDNLGLDFFYQIKSAKLPVADNKTVKLPPDYLNYSKVGVLNAKGEVITLTLNNKLTTYADLLPDRIEKTKDGSLFDYGLQVNGNIYYNYWGNNAFVNLYGLPSGQPFIGSFKIDEANGVILLDPKFTYEYIILEYAASPIQGQDYKIPIQFREALIAWLAWLDIRSVPSSRRGNLGDKRDRKTEFYNQRRLAFAQYKPFHVDEAYKINLESQRLTVKV